MWIQFCILEFRFFFLRNIRVDGWVIAKRTTVHSSRFLLLEAEDAPRFDILSMAAVNVFVCPSLPRLGFS